MAAKKKKTALKPGSKAVIYARYSCHNQRDVSIEQQIRECTKYAADMQLEIIGSYEDRAISGKTDKRPNFQRMMRDAEAGKFQAVLAWKSNRMGRDMLQAMVNEARLADCDVKVIYAEEDFDDTAAGRFALRNMMNVNQFYSENMAEDITRGLYDNATKCLLNGRQPLGYKRGPDGKAIIDEEGAAIVREIYTRVASHEPYADIARSLNARGLRTKLGAPWSKGSFQSILLNERYRGIYIYGDIRISGGIPCIINDDLWFRVQEVLKMKKNPIGVRHRYGAEDYLLTGKLRCGHCGSYMVGISGTSASGELHYYYACKKRRTEHTCDKKNVRRDSIELAIAQAIKMYALSDDVIDWIADQTIDYCNKQKDSSHIETIQQQLADIKVSTDNIVRAIEKGTDSDIFKSRLEELGSQSAELNAQLRTAKSSCFNISKSDMVAGLQMFRNGDIHDKKFQAKLFNTFLRDVYLYDDNRLKIVFSFTKDKDTIEIPFEAENTPPDGGEFPNAKMFVLGHESTTKKPLALCKVKGFSFLSFYSAFFPLPDKIVYSVLRQGNFY